MKIVSFVCLVGCLSLGFVMLAFAETSDSAIISIDCATDALFSEGHITNARIMMTDNEQTVAFDASVWPCSMTNDVMESRLPNQSLRVDGDGRDFILYNGGNDALNTRIINALCLELLDCCPFEIPARSGRTAEVYLNGEYYGLYTACETIENAIMRYEGLSGSDSLNICRADGTSVFGDASGFVDDLNRIKALHLSDEEDQMELNELLDWESVLNVLAVNSFFGNPNLYGSIFFYQVDNGPWKCAAGDFTYAFLLAADNSIARLFAGNVGYMPYEPLISAVDGILKAPAYRAFFLARLKEVYEALPVSLMQSVADMENARIAPFLQSQNERWAINVSAAVNIVDEYPVTSAEEASLYQQYRVSRLIDKTLITRPYYFVESVRRELELSDEEMLFCFGGGIPELPEVPGDTWEDYKAANR